jgi:hypothetical protein
MAERNWKLNDIAPLSLAQEEEAAAAAGSWGLSDSAPLPLGQTFAAAAAEWSESNWGPATLAFNAAQAGGAHLDASVSFAATGVASFNAQRIEPAAVTDTGVGIAAFAGARIQTAAAQFVATGTAAFNAVRTLITSVSFAAAGTFNAIASKVAGASVADTGAGAFGAQGERIQTGAVAETGVGALSAAAQGVLGASVAFDAHATFDAAAVQVQLASVSFVGAASLQVGEPPAVQLPSGGGGVSSVRLRPPQKWPVRRPQILTAAVAFRAEGIFAARAHIVPAQLPALEIVWPRYEEPAVAGHIDAWTEEEELVALLMFEEAA